MVDAAVVNMSSENTKETINERVFSSVRKYSDRISLSIGGRKITYSKLNRLALKVAAFLCSQPHLHKNIGIYTQRTFSAYAGLLGAIYAGCTYVPLNPKNAFKRNLSIVQSADISTIICDNSDDDGAREMISSSSDGAITAIYPEKDLQNIEPLVEPLSVTPSDLAYIMFTSGSTGEPKGVMVSHCNVCSHVQGMTEIYRFGPSDRLSQTFDLSFDPSVSDIFCSWFNGSTLCVLPADEMYSASDYIQREELTFWASVPTLANFMIKLGSLNPGIFPTLKYSTFCGEPLPQSLAKKWSFAAPNSTVENLYGPTEATIYVTRHQYKKSEYSRKYANRIVPIGLPLPGQSAVIVDEMCQYLDKGKVGELCVSGSHVTMGYLKDDEKTNQKFIKMPWEQNSCNRWYKTGDLAFVNENGVLECLGRIDSQIKIAGQRMELGEIESVLRELTKISEVAAVPVSYCNGAPQGIIAFVAKNVTTEEIASIQKSCKEKLLSAFVPKAIYPMNSLPLNTSGKVDRQKLKEMAASVPTLQS